VTDKSFIKSDIARKYLKCLSYFQDLKNSFLIPKRMILIMINPIGIRWGAVNKSILGSAVVEKKCLKNSILSPQ
jgi:hypothetical protein